MRCPDCNKFVSLESQDPEVELDIEGDLITGSVRCVRACAECGNELKETTFEWTKPIAVPEGSDHEHELVLEADDAEATESGGSRYAKNLCGFSLTYTVSCEVDGCKLSVEGSIEDSLQASAWDENC